MKLHLPTSQAKRITTSAREAVVLPMGKLVYDVEQEKLYVGDGSTAGGIEVGSGGGGGGGGTTSSAYVGMSEDDQEFEISIPTDSLQHALSVFCSSYKNPSINFPEPVGEGRRISVLLYEVPSDSTINVDGGQISIGANTFKGRDSFLLEFADMNQEGPAWVFLGIVDTGLLNKPGETAYTVSTDAVEGLLYIDATRGTGAHVVVDDDATLIITGLIPGDSFDLTLEVGEVPHTAFIEGYVTIGGAPLELPGAFEKGAYHIYQSQALGTVVTGGIVAQPA